MLYNTHRGFTLLEILITVLIIGVLAAIAVPQYQKAVLKSRFSSLMPTTKAIRDGQEMYYMTNGRYTNAVNKLDVSTATNNSGMTITLSDDSDYAYTMATRPNLNNNLIMYQKHSVNFPGEVHCEALAGNTQAEWLCETALHAVQDLGEGITPGYKEYVIEGPGMGFTPAQLEAAEVCNAATALGLTCNITTNAQGQKVKQVCQNGFCRTKTYNEDGSYTSVTCEANSENVCTSKWRFATYDKKGNKLTERPCNNVDSSGNCTAYDSFGSYDYTYDANDNQLTQRRCSGVDGNGKCTGYFASLEAYDYTYDGAGNMILKQYCNTVAANGSCSSYSSASTGYTYDENKNIVSERTCKTVAANGTCSAYSSGTYYYYDPTGFRETHAYSNYDYTYDEHGNVTSKRFCETVVANGTCSKYNTTMTNYPSEYHEYQYDTNGNKVAERTCNRVDSNGNCPASTSGYNYTYDANGNVLTKLGCIQMDSSGKCTNHANQYRYDYTYDDNGKQISEKRCYLNNAGECTGYFSPTVYAD